MSSIHRLKEEKRAIILRYSRADDVKGLTQVLTTLAFLALLWWVAVLSVGVSRWLTAPAVVLISLFALRVFVLMHECGHTACFVHGGSIARVGFCWA